MIQGLLTYMCKMLSIYYLYHNVKIFEPNGQKPKGELFKFTMIFEDFNLFLLVTAE